MKTKINLDKAASILVVAAYHGDQAAAAQFRVSVRTVQRYRAELARRKQLAEFVALKKTEYDRQWQTEMAGTKRDLLRYIARSARGMTEATPEMIHAVAGALKILAEIEAGGRYLEARLAEDTDHD